MDLLVNAILAGVLLGGFYAALAIGVTISFGMLDIVNIAHPGFIILGAFLAYLGWSTYGIDPLVSAVALLPVGFVIGCAFYRIYYYCFERRGEEALQGLAFFFGALFIIEVSLLLIFGVDYRQVSAPYIGPVVEFGYVSLPWRMIVPFICGVAMVVAMQVFLKRTYIGRVILAVSQDVQAVRLVGANPRRVKEIAFGLSIATGIVAGVLLIMIQPVEPSIGREFIGRSFAICVLGGMTSVWGTLIAAIVLGVVEAITSTYFGPSWSPAVAFGVLLLTLAFRPAGLFGR
jgi:branched-chain amino acid transport system permease protein